MAMIHTLKNLGDQVLNYLAEAGDTSLTRDVVYDTIRRLNAARVTERKWNFMLWTEPQTLSIIAGQRLYSLHQEFFRPFYFYNKTAKQFLSQNTEDTFLQTVRSNSLPYDPDFSGGVGDWTTATGNAYRFALTGLSPVAAQPTSASVLTVTGQASKTVTVYGETADGVTSETITVGTPGSVQFTKILDVAKGDGWTQTMTLTSNAGAVTNLKLFASEYGRQYRQLKLMATPVASEVVEYLFYHQPSAMPEANSIPNIPAPFSQVLVYDALIQLSAHNDELESGVLKHWKTEQLRLELGLIDYDAGLDAMGADTQYIQFRE